MRQAVLVLFIAITRNDIVMNQQLHAFVCSDILDPYFLAIFLKSRTDYMFSIAAATTVPYLNKDKCNSIPVPLPPLAEQHPIAEILSAVGRKLELERRRKEKLSRVKKGLMNELLTGNKRIRIE
ncbi:MAG: restriction endonuclease subunit S [ANME-2 cluster archaeon]|nr:restriction endonuclease subunit S [ANME-2 cluster archaeon]